MSDDLTTGTVVPQGHPGAAISAARRARGWSLSHVSLMLKIPERRLEAFEDGRWDEVGDRTFVRALTQSLCRHLGLDAAPLLASLPSSDAAPREWATHATLSDARAPGLGGLRRGTRLSGPGAARHVLARPSRWLTAVILAAAAALAFAPERWWATDGQEAVAPAQSVSESIASAVPPSSEAASVPSVSSAEPAAAYATPPSQPAPQAVDVNAAVASPAPAPDAVAGNGLRLLTTQATWVQVSDSRGQVLLSRLLRAGEQVDVDGPRPLSLRVGNVAGVQAQWRGQPLNLEGVQRNNVAQVDLP